MVRVTEDPLSSFSFAVSLGTSGSFRLGGFSEVAGLGAETEIQSIREGGVNEAMHDLAGPTKYTSRVVLKRGVTTSATLWNWYREVLMGTIRRELVTITVLSAQKTTAFAWTLRDACPVKWIGPVLNAGSSGVSVESVELVHRGIVLPGA
ncbi:phage tail protein [Ideonella sp. YS5]|uniref:phage tail protein n=1 Tax=Ideonella sp. YS5 TaxID=3453714 RepID=UPI003EE934E9